MMLNKKFIQYWSQKLYRSAFQAFGSRLYVDRNPDLRRSIFVAGTARSGTTWLADIIASQVKCRILFEPFQSELVRDFRAYNYFQYMHPAQDDEYLYAFANRIMTGQIRNRWIDHENEQIFPKFRLIKEIRANLFLRWLHERFPTVPLLFIIRHPCAVVLSRLQLKWATDSDIASFLRQPNLISDFLSDKLEFIKQAKYEEEKHAIIWSISNLVPITQFKGNNLKIVYYENLITQPDKELRAIFNYLNQPYKRSVIEQSKLPSLTTKRTSAVVTGKNKISNWEKMLSNEQINRVLNVVDVFGLSHLYSNEVTPPRTINE
jgi:hypothetical protein